jgi:hypothetical protein
VVEDRGFRRSGRAGVMVAGDRMQELRARLRAQPVAPLLDDAETEVDVAEEASHLGRSKARAGPQLRCSADVVQQRCRDEEVRA